MWNFAGSAYAVTGIPSKMGGVAEVPPQDKASTLRCVLVHGGAGDPPPRLNRALLAKKIEVQVTRDIYGAMAEVCRLADDDAVALPILAIVEPERIAHAADLFEAVSVYAPKAVLWVYTSRPHEQIREVRESDLAAWRRAAADAASSTHGTNGGGAAAAGPSAAGSVDDLLAHGRSATDNLKTSPADAANSGSRGDSGAVLTDEELEMLLSDHLPEEENGNDPGRGPRSSR